MMDARITTTPDASRLEASGVGVAFSGLTVLEGVDVLVQQREIVGLIGPNGAGKTTLVNVLSGYQRPDSGTITLGGRDVTGVAPHVIARHGLARTFQAVRPFARMSVAQNVEVAALRRGRSRRDARRRTRELLDRFELTDAAELEARSLPYGRERGLALARAMAMEPAFALLDEPAAGLDETETGRLLQQILDIRRDFGCGVLIIEHDMPLVMRLCDRIQVLVRGRTIAVGTPDEVRSNPDVIESYLSQAPQEAVDAAG